MASQPSIKRFFGGSATTSFQGPTPKPKTNMKLNAKQKQLQSKTLLLINEFSNTLPDSSHFRLMSSQGFKNLLVRLYKVDSTRITQISEAAKKKATKNAGAVADDSHNTEKPSPYSQYNGDNSETSHNGNRFFKKRKLNPEDLDEASDTTDLSALSPWKIEHKITSGFPHPSVKMGCQQYLDLNKEPWNVSSKLDYILDECTLLEFRSLKETLIERLFDSLFHPARRSSGNGLPDTWIMHCPDQLYTALLTISSYSEDARIHRAFAQVRLLKNVKIKAVDERKNPIEVLKSLTEQRAGDVSTMEGKRCLARYKTEFNAGERWIQLSKEFGGLGIVLVIVFSGTTLYILLGFIKFLIFNVDFSRFWSPQTHAGMVTLSVQVHAAHCAVPSQCQADCEGDGDKCAGTVLPRRLS